MRHRMVSSHFGGWVDPAACFAALGGHDEPVFWLDSGVDALAGKSCMGFGSRVISDGGGILCESQSGEKLRGNIFDFLRSYFLLLFV